MKINRFEFENSWDNFLGKIIIKHSGKPFKNGKKENFVKDITINPNSNKKAFIVEDGSVVDCQQCKLK